MAALPDQLSALALPTHTVPPLDVALHSPEPHRTLYAVRKLRRFQPTVCIFAL